MSELSMNFDPICLTTGSENKYFKRSLENIGPVVTLLDQIKQIAKTKV